MSESEENTEVKVKKTFDGPDGVSVEKTEKTTVKKEDNPKEAQD